MAQTDEKASHPTSSRLAPPARSTRNPLNKPTFYLHIKADLGLVERKIVNALLFQANKDNLEDEHQIPIRLLAEMIGFNSKNMKYLKDAVRNIQGAQVEFDLMDELEEGHQIWTVGSLLAEGSVGTDGMVRYSYGKRLAKLLSESMSFAQLNMMVVRQLKRTSSLILYENCVRYIGVGQTPRMSIDDIRKIFGVEDKKAYQEVKVLKRDVINKAKNEVNKHSNIHVEVLDIKSGRSIVGMQFKVSANRQAAFLGMGESSIDFDSDPTYQRLLRAGCSEGLAKQWIQTQPATQIQEALSAIEGKAGDVRNPDKYMSAIFANSSAPSPAPPKTKSVARQQGPTPEEQRTLLRDERLELDRAYRGRCLELIEGYINSLAAEDEEALFEDFRATKEDQLMGTEAKELARHRWSSSMLVTHFREFLAGKVDFPSKGDFAQDAGFRDPDEIEAELERVS